MSEKELPATWFCVNVDITDQWTHRILKSTGNYFVGSQEL